MKKNVNVFIAVLLVAVLCGGVIWLQTADEEKLGWNIHDSYGDTPSYSGGAAYTNATFAGPSAGEGGVMSLSSSSALRARTSYSYAGAYAISYGVSPASSPIANSLTASSPSGAGLYTTSSKTFNSYGGGGNGGAAMGGAMRSSSSPNSLIASSPITSISPIAYSTARRGEMSSAAGDNPAQMLAENPAMAMTNATSTGVGNAIYSCMGYTTMGYYGSSSYGSPAGIRGRRNTPGMGDSWTGWLGNGDFWGEGYEDWAKGSDQVTEDLLRALYVRATGDTDFSNEELWQAFLAWFNSQQDNESFGWYWAPISDAIPFLLLLCAIWALVVYRRTRTQTNSCKETEK